MLRRRKSPQTRASDVTRRRSHRNRVARSRLSSALSHTRVWRWRQRRRFWRERTKTRAALRPSAFAPTSSHARWGKSPTLLTVANNRRLARRAPADYSRRRRWRRCRSARAQSRTKKRCRLRESRVLHKKACALFAKLNGVSSGDSDCS